ncbi:hypothetical protein JHK86_019785 [Glycine max]|nr:hypothetical protein JHK86_019785 [Glycine max]
MSFFFFLFNNLWNFTRKHQIVTAYLVIISVTGIWLSLYMIRNRCMSVSAILSSSFSGSASIDDLQGFYFDSVFVHCISYDDSRELNC